MLSRKESITPVRKALSVHPSPNEDRPAIVLIVYLSPDGKVSIETPVASCQALFSPVIGSDVKKLADIPPP